MTSLTASLARGALTSPFKRAGRPDATLPPDRPTRPAAPAEPGPLAAYGKICGFPESGELPLTYPHVLAFPLTMRLMTGRAFPLPVLGLVHTWIEITPHRTVAPAEPLELTVYAEKLTPHRRGTEVTMTTEARVGGELVWESRSGYLSRHRQATPDGTTPDETASGGAASDGTTPTGKTPDRAMPERGQPRGGPGPPPPSPRPPPSRRPPGACRPAPNGGCPAIWGGGTGPSRVTATRSICTR